MSVSPARSPSPQAGSSGYRERSPHRRDDPRGGRLHPPDRSKRDDLGIPLHRSPRVTAFIRQIPTLTLDRLCNKMPPSSDFGTEPILDSEVMAAIIQRLPRARARCPYPQLLKDPGLIQKLLRSLRYIHPICHALPITEQYIQAVIDHLKSVESLSGTKILQDHGVLYAISVGLAELPHSPARQALFEMMVNSCAQLTDPPHPNIIRNYLCLLNNMPTSAASEQLLAKLTEFIRRSPPNTFLNDAAVFIYAGELPRTAQSDALQDALIDNLISKKELTLEQLSLILAYLHHRTSSDQADFDALWALYDKKLRTTPTAHITSDEFRGIARTLRQFVEHTPRMTTCMQALATHLQHLAPHALSHEHACAILQYMKKLPLNHPDAPSNDEPIAQIIRAVLPHITLYASPPVDMEALFNNPAIILSALSTHANLPVCRDALQAITQALSSVQTPTSHEPPYQSVGKMLYALRPFLLAHPQEALACINAFCAVCKYPTFTANDLQIPHFNQTLKTLFSPLLTMYTPLIDLHGYSHELAAWLLSQRLQHFIGDVQEKNLCIVCGVGKHHKYHKHNLGKMAAVVERQLANHCEGNVTVTTHISKGRCTINKYRDRQHPPKNPADMTLENHAAVLAEKQKPLMVPGKTIESRFNRHSLVERREIREDAYRGRRHHR